MTMIYKICSATIWQQAETAGFFAGAGIDLADGYIHFSSLFQVRETAEKHFSGQNNLLIIEVDQEKLNIVWEVSRGGDLFPHLYATLPLTTVISVKPMSLSRSGEPEPLGGWRAYLERFINPY